jgi:hypothetical protein
MKKDPRFLIGVVSIVLLFSVVGVYAYYRTSGIRNGPIITITSPQNNALITNNSQLSVTGNIKNAISVSLDDRKIFLDEAGNFSEKLLLAPGYTIITVKAEDQFNRTALKKLSIDFKN